MDKNRANVPKIRFPGFTEEWEQRQLGDTLKDLKSGLSRMLSNSDIGLPVVRANNINEGNLDMESDVKYWYEKDPQGAKTEKYLVYKNDILINFINSETKMGTSAIVLKTLQRDTIYTTNILKAQINSDYFPYYWFTLTQTQKYKVDIKIITKPAVNQASFTTIDFKKLSYQFPGLREQEKIGDFFHKFDNLIALHQRKLTHLQAKKKGLLQKMFPKDGERFPELRFPGFTEEWEQRKLEEVVDIRSGRDYKHLSEGTIPVYGTGGYMLSVDEALSYSEDAIGIGRKGTIDKPYILKAPFWTVDTLFHAVPKANYNLNYVFDIFQKIDWKMKDESTGVPSLSKNTINGIDVLVTKFNEQKIIGSFFYKIDNLITLHQRKLTHLQEQKKALLQQMFV